MEQQQPHAASIAALNDIRSMMERSSRFVSLSGWSGIWAGSIGLVAALIAYNEVQNLKFIDAYHDARPAVIAFEQYFNLLCLAIVTVLVAGAGAFFFTLKKARKQQLKIWGAASKKLLAAVLIPMLAGGVFCISLLDAGYFSYLAPTCLAFYGMALVNGGKYTLGEIRYLGYSELLLGCTCLFFPGYGLLFWTVGFGVLHIVYGIIMWNRYDKKQLA